MTNEFIIHTFVYVYLIYPEINNLRRTKKESEATKEKIIDAALYIFLEKGFSQTSVDDIVKPLNLTRGAFYWHFKDKDDVFRSIIEKEHSQRIVSMSIIEEQITDERTKLEKIMNNILDHFYDNARFRSFIKLRWFRVEQDPYKFSVPVTELMNKKTQSIILNTLNAAKEKKLLQENIDPEETTFLLIALTNGIYRLYFLDLGFYSKKENVKKMILKYINQLFII